MRYRNEGEDTHAYSGRNGMIRLGFIKDLYLEFGENKTFTTKNVADMLIVNGVVTNKSKQSTMQVTYRYVDYMKHKGYTISVVCREKQNCYRFNKCPYPKKTVEFDHGYEQDRRYREMDSDRRGK